MSTTNRPARVAPSAHLEALTEHAHVLRAALATVAEPSSHAGEIVAGTLRLEGAHLSSADVATLADPGRILAAGPNGGVAANTTLDALGYTITGHEDDSVVRALEVRGVIAALTAADLTSELRADPRAALARAHTLLTAGLLDADTAGTLRVTDQVVHDAADGRIVFFPTDTSALGTRFDRLMDHWDDLDADPLRAAAVVHHELLVMHPFEAANGRLARIAVRHLLASADLIHLDDAPFEAALAEDRLGYWTETAADEKRGALAKGAERLVEAVVAGLRASAEAAGLLDDADADGWIDGLPLAFTLGDARDASGQTVDEVRRILLIAEDAGKVRLEPATFGLRWRRSV